MTPNQRAKKAAKALDLYEQALNLALEVRADIPADREITGGSLIWNGIHEGQKWFRTLRQIMEAEERIAKEGEA